MFGGRGGTPPIDQDTAEWVEDCFSWLLKHQGGFANLVETPLVLPTSDFFPFDHLDGHALGEAAFDQVRRFAGMEDWPCTFRAEEIAPDAGAAYQRAQGGPPPAGRFILGSDPTAPPTITYDPALVHDPAGLVATLAHELAHYLVASIDDPPPEGWENVEFVTEIVSVFLGFGIFVVNTSFRFDQAGPEQGGVWRRQGYLPAAELTYALGLFVALQGQGRKQVLAHLKEDQQPVFKKTLQYLEKNDAITARLRQTEIRSAVVAP